MKIKPLGKRIVVKRAEAQMTKGGIFLPETAQEKPKQGEVVAVGPGEIDTKGNLIPLTIKLKDRVLFSSYSGVEFKSDEENTEYLILSEDDVLAIVK
jgi:chaperonin GroES